MPEPMPEPGPDGGAPRRPGELNEAQKRRLSITCIYIDGLLCYMEHALRSASSESPFPRYVVDVSSAQAREVEDHIRRLRSELLRLLAWQHMEPEHAQIPVTRSVLTDLSFVDNAIEELKPRYLRGCGAVPEDAIEELNGALHKLRALVKDMDSYVRQVVAENADPDGRS